MPSFTCPTNSTKLFFQYYVPGQHVFKPQVPGAPALTLVFLHGWPMSSQTWDHLMVTLCESFRFRWIAPDKRGFVRSEWNSPHTEATLTWKMLIDDLVGILKYLEVGDFRFVAASMGCAESLHAYHANEFVRERCKLSSRQPYINETHHLTI
jgi:pimeloyl-ACP methyl ester carboxylesterase